MQSIVNEIMKLRNGQPIVVDRQNRNRYRLVACEEGGSKTAYYFSTPIYNRFDRKMVDVKFHTNGTTVYATGSEAQIRISEGIALENKVGTCMINIGQKPAFVSGRELRGHNVTVAPTINGVALKFGVEAEKSVSFSLSINRWGMSARANDKCFAFMQDKFRPFVVMSGLGSLNAAGNIIAPAKIEHEKVSDREYKITLSATSPMAQYVMCECNLYENKLFQDTTVESKNPSTNNAFGGTAFIGNTLVCGEQWLYTRPDYSSLSDVMDKRVQSAVLHMPKLNWSDVGVRAFKVTSRFCSFGSNWNNKVPGGMVIADSQTANGYQSIDLTPLLVDQRTRTMLRTEGVILRPKVKGSGFSVLSTGDSYYAPQILEINYR